MSLASSTLFAERNSLVTVGPDPPTPVFAVLAHGDDAPGACLARSGQGGDHQVGWGAGPGGAQSILAAAVKAAVHNLKVRTEPAASIMQVRLPEANEPQMSAGTPLG